MSIDFILRLIGMVVFAVLGVIWGTSLGETANLNPTPQTFSVEQYAFTIGLVGALFGLILTPMITTRPVRALRTLLTHISAQSLFSAIIGLIVGLIIAALAAFPLTAARPIWEYPSFVGVLVFGYIGVSVFMMRQADLFHTWKTLSGRGEHRTPPRSLPRALPRRERFCWIPASLLMDA